MLTFEERKTAFVDLGHHIETIIDKNSLVSSQKDSKFEQILRLAKAENQWFTEENICNALSEWSKALDKKSIDQWLEPYDFNQNIEEKKVGIVMAGNIPLVGFHDFLSVLMSGHKVIAKLSSNDRRLLPYLSEVLCRIEPKFKLKIKFEEHQLKDFDAVIATGSNNTARYFEYYFRDKPHIIRKNRNGVSILTGYESKEDFQKLGQDIFMYFGLGCRNVSKLFIPKDFDFESFFEGISNFKSYIHHHKYANNYDYNKAVYLMSDIKFIDNGFLILKEDESLSSPIGVLNYEYYENDKHLEHFLNQQKNNIQCTIGNHKLCSFDFGKAQQPELSDYADGIDTINFLKNIDKHHYEKTQF